MTDQKVVKTTDGDDILLTDTANIDVTDFIGEDWVKIDQDGYFICPECENRVKPNTNTIDGIVEADLPKIFQELSIYPTKIIYAICPVCGMEYEFKKVGDSLYLKPSVMEK